MIRPAGIATSDSPPKKHFITGSVLLSLSQSTHPRHTVKILLIMSQSSSHKICEVIEPVASFSQLLLSSRENFTAFLQQNRLHQLQKNVPTNDYFTFVTVFPILKKVQHFGLKRYFLFF